MPAEQRQIDCGRLLEGRLVRRGAEAPDHAVQRQFVERRAGQGRSIDMKGDGIVAVDRKARARIGDQMPRIARREKVVLRPRLFIHGDDAHAQGDGQGGRQARCSERSFGRALPCHEAPSCRIVPSWGGNLSVPFRCSVNI